MSKGFGMLANLKDLAMQSCERLKSLPESTSQLTSHFCVSNFGNLMSEGFGNLAGLQKLNMEKCTSLGSLPNSESHHSDSFYFLIFDVQRLWNVVVSDQRCFWQASASSGRWPACIFAIAPPRDLRAACLLPSKSN